MTTRNLASLIATKKILVTCGTGGVGKTTLSAALGCLSAMQGRKTLVLTLDPSKRLAQALGIQALSDDPIEIALPTTKPGLLWAMAPDTERTFEKFVLSLAARSGDPKIAERVFKNPIYQIFAREFSGTHEYMALEKVEYLARETDPERRYDLIILDTPPSRNTLDFFKAPGILNRIFDERVLRWLVLPEKMRGVFSLLERMTGSGFMNQFFDFAKALFEVRGAFSSHLATIDALLKSPDVGILMVTAPSPETLADIRDFVGQVSTLGVSFEGIIMNRSLAHLELPSPGEDQAAPHLFAILRSIQGRELDLLHRLESEKVPLLARVPERNRDVHSLEDLIDVAQTL